MIIIKGECVAMNNEKEIIGQIIQARKAKKLSQTQLGEITGNSQQVISKIERGKSIPNLSTLCRILDALDCEMIIKEPKEEIFNVTEEIEKRKEIFKDDVEEEMDQYAKINFVNSEQKEWYDKYVECLKDIGIYISVEEPIGQMAEALMCFEIARAMFRKNPKTINLSLLVEQYRSMKYVKEYFTDIFLSEISLHMESIDFIWKVANNSR